MMAAMPVGGPPSGWPRCGRDWDRAVLLARLLCWCPHCCQAPTLQRTADGRGAVLCRSGGTAASRLTGGTGGSPPAGSWVLSHPSSHLSWPHTGVALGGAWRGACGGRGCHGQSNKAAGAAVCQEGAWHPYALGCGLGRGPTLGRSQDGCDAGHWRGQRVGWDGVGCIPRRARARSPQRPATGKSTLTPAPWLLLRVGRRPCTPT